MTETPIDPAATPDDENAAEIAADDVGASAAAERAAKAAKSQPGGMAGEGSGANDADDERREGMAGEGM